MQAAPHEAPLDPLRTLLRSFGQIVLQANALTGACVLAAWLVCDVRLACAALTGAIAANVAALLRGYDLREIRDGLHGFNGALAALAAASFITDTATAMAVAILASTAAAWLLEPWARLLRSRGLGFYSSPCLLATWVWLPAMYHASTVHVIASAAPSWPMTVHGVLAGIAQTAFASSALAGGLILGGIAVSSVRSALFGLMGTLLATAAHVLIGVDTASLDAGLAGFNGALVALALADCGVLSAAGGVFAAVLLQQAALVYGIPALTAPFVIATWTIRWMMRDTRRIGMHETPAQTKETICRSLTRPRGASRSPG